MSYLARTGSKRNGPFQMEQFTGTVDDVAQGVVGPHMLDIQNAGYADVKPGRRLKVFVNPKAGSVSRSLS